LTYIAAAFLTLASAEMATAHPLHQKAIGFVSQKNVATGSYRFCFGGFRSRASIAGRP
jgi:hypothetical protein